LAALNTLNELFKELGGGNKTSNKSPSQKKRESTKQDYLPQRGGPSKEGQGKITANGHTVGSSNSKVEMEKTTTLRIN